MAQMLKIVSTFLKSLRKRKKENKEEYGTETLCGLSSLKYLLSGLTLNHSLNSGTLRCSKLFRKFAFESKDRRKEEMK